MGDREALRERLLAFAALMEARWEWPEASSLMRDAAAALAAPTVVGGFRVVADPKVPRDEIHWRDAEGNLLGKITGLTDVPK